MPPNRGRGGAGGGSASKRSRSRSQSKNRKRDWNDKDTTIVSAPEANHFVQQDAAELVSKTLKWWLMSRH